MLSCAQFIEAREAMTSFREREQRFRAYLYLVIFGTHTAAGRRFDLVLLLCIVSSLLAVMLDSIDEIARVHGPALHAIEWAFTVLFTIEYLLRLYCAPRPWQYARSGWGIIDLLAFLPTYVAAVFPEAASLLVIRAIRMIRIFRILHLQYFSAQATLLGHALRNARGKIFVFLFSMLILATLFGTTLYIVEGGENGFTSIPRSIYWAIITITTVGYGDISPVTPLGQAIAALVTLTGYSIIAVPTGIITGEVIETVRQVRPTDDELSCRNCGATGHDSDARHCKACGARLPV